VRGAEQDGVPRGPSWFGPHEIWYPPSPDLARKKSEIAYPKPSFQPRRIARFSRVDAASAKGIVVITVT
jgi:hypothetical protein